MKLKVKSLFFSGFAGILVACLVFATAIGVPWLESETRKYISVPAMYYPSLWIPYPATDSRVKLNASISKFTDPAGIGSEGEITVFVESTYDIANVTIQIDLSQDWPSAHSEWIRFPDGNSTRSWITNLQANVSKSFTEKIKAFKIGFGTITVTAKWNVKSQIPYDVIGLALYNPINLTSISTLVPMNVSFVYFNVTPEIVTVPANISIMPAIPVDAMSLLNSTVKLEDYIPQLLHQNVTFLQSYESKDSLLVGVWNDGILVTRGSMPESPLCFIMRVSNFTQPQTIGSEANLTIYMKSYMDMQNVTAQIILPKGLSLVDGDSIWNGDMKANTTIKIKHRIRAEKVGDWTIAASAGALLPDGPWFGDADVYGTFWCGDAKVIGLAAYEDGLSVYGDAILQWSGDESMSPFPVRYRNSVIQMFPDSQIYLEPAMVNWSGGSYNLGDTFTLEVRVTNVVDLYGIQFHLQWDPSILALVSVEKGSVFEALRNETIFVWKERDSKNLLTGYLPLGSARNWPEVNIATPDSGLVATIKFQVINFTSGTRIFFSGPYDTWRTLWAPRDCVMGCDILAYGFEQATPTYFVFENQTN